MDKRYPKWIDEYAKAFHNAFAHMVPSSWGPLDGFAVFTALNGTFLSKIYSAIKIIKDHGNSISEISSTFSCVSSLRAMLFFLIYEYQQSHAKDKEQFKEIIEFFVEILVYIATDDAFAYESNIAHSKAEVEKILDETPWSDGVPRVAREIGKLYNSLASLVFALYSDFFPQDSHEIYGPYPADKKFGQHSILLIKYFPKIRPVDLWPELNTARYHNARILQVYRNVKFKCEMIGMHSIYEGDLMNGLVAYAVLIDGKYYNDPKDIEKLSDYFAELATKQSLAYEHLSKEELKKKFLEWECYQFFNLFKLAKMDWRPTKEMLKALRDKDIPDRLRIDQFPSFEEFLVSPEFEVYWLKDLYK